MIKPEREYRNVELKEFELKDEGYIVEGYAALFDAPYVLWEDEDGKKYSEVISKDAFGNTDLSDVVFLFNHEGKPFARLKNDTLQLTFDEKGIKVRADLSSTASSRDMYEEIKTGLVDKMSWAFTIRPEGDEFDRKTLTRTVKDVKKIYDVSAVTFPANPNTEISARNYFNGVIEVMEAERLQRQKEINKIKIKMKLGGNYGN